METIHLKTIDPISQELISSASQRGIELPWERNEKLQPQDGFLRLGLSCPFGCMQGPCRIDPFERGPGKGVCGLERDEMVAGMLLRLCLKGAMDACGLAPSLDGLPKVQFSATLGKMISPILVKNNQPELSIEDIFKASTYLHRPSSTYQQLISQSLRVSLLTLGFLEQALEETGSDPIEFRAGYGTIAGHSLRIGFSGQPSAQLVQALELESTKDSNKPVSLVSLGEWILLKNQFMPMACTSGESELLVSSGAIHLLVAGPGTDPGLIAMCRQLNVPVVSSTDISEPSSVLDKARKVHATLSQAPLFADTSPVGEGQVLMSEETISQIFKSSSKAKLAIVGGSDTLQLSLGRLPVELARKLCDKEIQTASWGDAALWMSKNGLTTKEQKMPLLTLENHQGPLLAVKGLAGSGHLDNLQGICFTGLKSCSDLAMGLGLAYLGCNVNVAGPIPILGSQAVSNTLAEMLQDNGGQLKQYDHPVQTQEIIDWFINL